MVRTQEISIQIFIKFCGGGGGGQRGEFHRMKSKARLDDQISDGQQHTSTSTTIFIPQPIVIEYSI